MSGIYLDVKASLLAFCKRSKQAVGRDDMEVFDFDTHAAQNKLPGVDLIGVGDYSLTDEQETHIGSCSVAVCTLSDDTLLGRLSTMIDYLYSQLSPGTQIPVVKRDNGQHVGFITVTTPMTVLPVVATETRPLQEIMVSFAVALETPPR